MSKFKKGDRCQVIQDDSQFHAGAKVTVLEDNSETPFCKADHISMVKDDFKIFHLINTNCINESILKLITMEDKEITTKVSGVLEAHAKGCSTGKKMIEALYPEVFNREKTFKVGQKFDLHGTKTMLCQIEENKCILICITDGNRMNDAVEVKDSSKVTMNEVEKMTIQRPIIPIP